MITAEKAKKLTQQSEQDKKPFYEKRFGWLFEEIELTAITGYAQVSFHESSLLKHLSEKDSLGEFYNFLRGYCGFSLIKPQGTNRYLTIYWHD